MDNNEFETRAYTNPDDSSQDFLDALMDNPARQQLLDELKALNERIGHASAGISLPEGLLSRLKSSARADETPSSGTDETSVAEQSRSFRPMRLLAMAAALVLAVGLSYTTLFNGGNPSAEELEFGQQVVNHVYRELAEIDSSQGAATLQQVNLTMGVIGGTLDDSQTITTLRISFARPCAVVPPNQSAHLVMQGNRGAINIIIINNSPVKHEFRFNDDRFDTLVIPLENGNLILVGERNEALGDYRQVIADNMEWLI